MKSDSQNEKKFHAVKSAKVKKKPLKSLKPLKPLCSGLILETLSDIFTPKEKAKFDPVNEWQ